MECRSCGVELLPGAAFCHRCRRRTAEAPSLPAPAAPGTRQDRRSSDAPPIDRPRVLSTVAALDFLVAAVALTPAAVVAATLDAAEGDPVFLGVAGLSALVAGLAAVAGTGVLQLEEYGRKAQVALTALGLPLIPVGTLVSILLWSYLSRPGTRLLFSGRTDLSPAEIAEATGGEKAQGLALAAAVVGIAIAGLLLLSLLTIVVVGVFAAIPAGGAGMAAA